MEKLLKLEEKLRKAKAELEKQSILGSMNPIGSGVNEASVDKGEKDVETCGKMDSKKDQKIIAEALDDHNENKHGEAKDEDSAKKDMKKGETFVKFHSNGQWSLEKSTVDAKPDGKFDVSAKEVLDGDDEFVHVGNRGVDGDDKGKTEKLSEKEQRLLKD